jgi:peptidoglycan/LPS O-acetylase OafA/YrhL
VNTTASITKPHYLLLDGLRGVASVMVVAFHIFEAHSTSHFDQVINHGYLAVDFFFLLSGFVVGYAYDDRWGKMTVGGFFKLRLIRLQPMVVLGSVIGACCFYFQDSSLWPAIHSVPTWKMLFIMLIGCTLIPVPTSMDIRGWQEMHPLNGPAWSLFFEYTVNILYALIVRKFSKMLLGILVFLSAAALIQLSVTGANGDVIGGWSLDPQQLRIGFTRVMFPFFAGLLLCRTASFVPVKNTFVWCSALLILVLAMPRVGGSDHLWQNGLYDALCIIIAFPFIIWLGAGGSAGNKISSRICTFLGNISYPVYITHYPFIYIYTGWVADHKPTMQQALPFALLTFAASILVGFACLKWYDEPVRRWLKKKV